MCQCKNSNKCQCHKNDHRRRLRKLINYIKAQLNFHMEGIVERKDRFLLSVESGNPSFELYIDFFNFLRTNINRFLLPRINRPNRLGILFYDKNNKTIFMNIMNVIGTVVHNSVTDLTTEQVYQDYYLKYLNGTLYPPTPEESAILDYVQQSKNTEWKCFKLGKCQRMTARYTPDKVAMIFPLVRARA